MLNGYSEQVLMNAGIQAIVATGLYLILLSGQLQAGQAAFVGIGAYASAALTAKFGIAFPIALLVAALLTFGVAAALAAVTLRLRHMFLAVATFAFGQVLVVALLNIPFLGQATGLYGMPIITSLWLVYGTLALVLWFAWRLENSRYGQALRALGEDELTAEAIGVDTRRLRILAFAIGSMIGGIGGVLYVHMLGLIAPDDVDFVRSATYLVYVVVGGVTTFWAPLIGTYVLTILPELLRFTNADRYLIYGLLLVLIVIFAPRGIVRRVPVGHTSRVQRLVLRARSAGRARSTAADRLTERVGG